MIYSDELNEKGRLKVVVFNPINDNGSVPIKTIYRKPIAINRIHGKQYVVFKGEYYYVYHSNIYGRFIRLFGDTI